MKTPLVGRIAFIAVAAFAATLPSPLRAQSATTPNPDDNGPGDGAVVKLSPFDVSAKGDKGYNTASSVGATMFNSPTIDTPMSIVALNSQFIQDTGAIDIVDAALYVSGVAAAGAPGSGQLTVRGLNIPGANIRDGIYEPINSAAGNTFTDTALIDRIEVIKGPEGVLYGEFTTQGGLVNTVSKLPQAIQRSSLSVTYGADDLGGTIYRSVFDATGPDPQNKRLDYRLILVGQQGTTLQGGRDDTFILAPMLTYHFRAGGEASIRYTYQDFHRGTNEYQWFIDQTGHLSTFIPAKISEGDLDAGRENAIQTLDVNFTQPFTTGPIKWNLRYYLRGNEISAWNHLYEPAAANFQFLDANGNLIGNITNTSFSNPAIATMQVNTRTRSDVADIQKDWDNGINLLGEANFGPINNKILLYGSDLFQYATSIQWAGAYPLTVLYSNVPGVVVDYHYADPVAAQAAFGNLALTADNEVWTSVVSTGGQDVASMFDDKINLVFGIREDRQVQTTANYFAKTFIPGDVRTGTTRKLGFVYRVVEPVALFYNYSQTFSPNGFANNLAGQSYKLPNVDSTINEGGAKFSLFHDSLLFTGSYFSTVSDNAIVSIPEINSAGQSVAISVPAGRTTIKGWEADGTWVITNNLFLQFGVGNLTSKTATGLFLRAVPLGTNYKGLAKYTFDRTFLKNAFVGVGFQHIGNRGADSADDATLPPYNLTNAFVGYTYDRHWRAQVNINNVFDVKYASVAVARQIQYAGLPTNASVTLSYSY